MTTPTSLTLPDFKVLRLRESMDKSLFLQLVTLACSFAEFEDVAKIDKEVNHWCLDLDISSYQTSSFIEGVRKLQ